MAAQFYLTDAGKHEIIQQQELGLRVKLTHVALGTGIFDAQNLAANKTTLVAEKERFSLSGGFSESASKSLRLYAFTEASLNYSVHEIGIFTEAGTLFAIASSNNKMLEMMVNITSIFTFGLAVDDLDVANITVSVDANSPLALSLIQKHISNNNPHPQYLLISDFDKNHLQAADPHDQYLLKDDFNQYMNNIYPRVIAAGVVAGGKKNINVANKITSDLRSNMYSIQLTPESNHEAWEIKRNIDSFDIEVWARLGADRAPYSGNINWQLTQNSPNETTSGDGDYYVGTHFIHVLPNETKEFILISGGGAGGGSVWEDYPRNNGGNGGVTSLYLNGTELVTVDGGHGGACGQWSNGSHYNNGGEGTRGDIFISNLVVEETKILGNIGGNLKGGESVSTIEDWGKGGDAASGVGDSGLGYGTGGTSGGYAKVKYKNTTDKAQTLTLVVGGKGMPAASNGNAGMQGVDGFARVLVAS